MIETLLRWACSCRRGFAATGRKVCRRNCSSAGGTAAAVLLGGSLGWRAWRSSYQEDGATGTEVVARMTCDEAIPLIPTLVANELLEATRRRVERISPTASSMRVAPQRSSPKA